MTMPLGGDQPLVDPHAHFHTARSSRPDWAAVNRSRLTAGERIGVRVHVASILGTWGRSSPTYFASPADLTHANAEMLALAAASGGRVRAWVAVNPNFPEHAQTEITRGVAAGAIGLKLAAGRRCTHRATHDPLARRCAELGWPILQHVWQHRAHPTTMQDASNGTDVAEWAARHPDVRFLLAHIGGGGDWAHTLPAIAAVPNVVVDASGSGIDRGMLDAALEALGTRRVLWAADLTLCTGLTKLWALEQVGLDADGVADVRWRNAARLFPPGSLAEGLSRPVDGELAAGLAPWMTAPC
jgi:predicted TIM-barrel fold metal-dependent hydrolase